MIDPAFFHTTEFFVIAVVAAALIVGFMARPSNRGEARQYFVPTTLSSDDTPADDISITVACADDGTVTIQRHGLPDVHTSGMVNLVVTIVGFDITIQERIIEGDPADPSVNTATATLDMLGAERYHLTYRSEALSRFAALTLTNLPTFRSHRPLTLS